MWEQVLLDRYIKRAAFVALPQDSLKGTSEPPIHPHEVGQFVIAVRQLLHVLRMGEPVADSECSLKGLPILALATQLDTRSKHSGNGIKGE
jgi:hypothetical protein